MNPLIISILLLLFSVLVTPCVTASDKSPLQPLASMRLDFFHSGNARQELYSFDQLVKEPLPWAGNPSQPIDNLARGKYLFEIKSPDGKQTHYSRSFSSIYGEWETTDEARKINRTFHESLRFPKPEGEFTVRIKKRDENNDFQLVWQMTLDADDYMVHQEQGGFQQQVIAVEQNGDPQQKVDLLILGDGYTQAEQSAFKRKAQDLAETFLSAYPFSKRRKDFNVWALAPVAEKSGISRPSSSVYRDSPLASQYDAFRSERYLLTFDNKKWRQIASSAPYDAVIIVTNTDTYGGGGIYGLYSTAAANSAWADYLFVHEFGHHFAGLADEYYTSSVAYQTPEHIVEPYEPNVTALLDPKKLKWRHLVAEATPLPTPWPKAEFEKHSIAYQKVRAQLRKDGKPEAEMNQLFIDIQKFVEGLFNKAEYTDHIGAFEGANYNANGYYRSSMNCIMFSRTKDFCHVCSHAIEQMVDLYVKP